MYISESNVQTLVKDTNHLNIKGICNNIQSNIIALSDIAFEDDLTSKTFEYTRRNGSASQITYSSEGTKFASVIQAYTPILTEATSWEMTFEMKPSTSTRVGVGIGIQDVNATMFATDVSNTGYFNKNVYTTNWNTIKIVREGNEYYAIINNNTSNKITKDNPPENRLSVWKWGGGNMILRNLKVKLI